MMAMMRPGVGRNRTITRQGLPAVLATIFLILVIHGHAGASLRIPLNDAGIFNPDRGPLRVNYELRKDAKEVEVRIRDFRGQIVNQYRFIDPLAANKVFEWDGRDQNEDRLPDGAYELIFVARFKDDSRGRGVVNARIADIKPSAELPVPETLPPEKHAYKISGSLSSFWRHNGDSHENSGQLRSHTRFSYANEVNRLEGVFSFIDTYPGGDSNLDASQAFIERKWGNGRIKHVFREGLGGFDDPVKLFSDFKSERKKFGVRVEQGLAEWHVTGLAFSTEGDVDSEETGSAARLQYGEEGKWQWGASYTYRKALLEDDPDERNRNHAMAADLRVPVLEPLALVLEFIHTDDGERGNDIGFNAGVDYDQGRLRMAARYIDLGEDFAADFADPLNGITTDARGIEANLDYAVPAEWLNLRNPTLTSRFFTLRRHSDDEWLREIDTAFRFGIGSRDNILLSWYGQDNEDGTTNTLLGTLTHQWNEQWNSSLQVNNITGEDSGTRRFTCDTTYRHEQQSARLALEWIQRTIDDSDQSPKEETNLRLDWDSTRWGVQMQTRYSEDEDDSGYNFFGYLEYRPQFLHRYQIITYASLGDRAAFEFEERMEVGMELRY